MEMLLLLIAIVIAVFILVQPVKHAERVNHPNQLAISVLVILGCFVFFPLWIIAAVWSVKKFDKPEGS